MTVEILLVCAVLLVVLALLAASPIAPDAILMAGLTGMLVLPVPLQDGGWKIGILTPEQAFGGFANTGLATVGVLFVVVRGLTATGGVDWIAGAVLGRPGTLRGAMSRVMAPVLGMSALLNNTPVVAMLIPAIGDWARRIKMPASKLLIPLSYSAILGGMCTLIGTSTNLVVAGLVVEQGLEPLGLFTITPVGLAAAVIGFLGLLLIGPRLLPDRSSAMEGLGDPREYTLEMIVPEGSPLEGKSVEQAGLRNLPGCFLVEIERGSDVQPAVGPQAILRAGDRLVFVGVLDAVRELRNSRGLLPANKQLFRLGSPGHKRRLYEAVLGPSSPLTGRTVRGGRFRTRYGGAILAIARDGRRLPSKIGDVRLQAGDVLLVESDPTFAARLKDSRDFLLINPLQDSSPRRHDRAPIAIGVLVAMIAIATSGLASMLTAALFAAMLMILTRCCTVNEARGSVDWSVLVVIGAALGIGRALQESGAADLLARTVTDAAGGSPWLALAAVYLVTAILTEIITNNAAVALAFPIAFGTAQQLGVSVMPFVIAIMMAGSGSFATPLGYQTNLMVYGPGGYRFTDFLRIGLPMALLVGGTTLVLTPLIFPF